MVADMNTSIKVSDSDYIQSTVDTAETIDVSTTYAKVFSGADKSAATPSKIGDIFVQNDGKLFISKGVLTTSWVELDITP
jgi:hypothetical protein